MQYNYEVTVTDPAGDPAPNINVVMIGMYDLWEGNQSVPYTVFEYGQTDQNGYVALRIWVEVTGYYPENYNFYRISVDLNEPQYSIVSSEGTISYYPVGAASFVILHDEDRNGIKDEYEILLAQKFCPSLVLNSQDQGVAPEPVEIMKVDMTDPNSYFYVDLWDITQQHVSSSLATSQQWIIYGSHVGNEYFPCGNDLVCSNYSDFPGWLYSNLSPPNPIADGWYSINFHPDWGGPDCDTPVEWYALYNQVGVNFPNTVYPHLFLNGNEVVIQYWFFYPFNAFINRHEGDWEHINVIVDSENPTVANIVRVEYFFHHLVLNRFPSEILFDDATHPIVFVGGSNTIWIPNRFWTGHGSHGSFPTYGLWLNVGANVWPYGQLDEYVYGDGLVIKYSDFNKTIIPNPNALDYNQNPEMSWLQAKINWGQLIISESAGNNYLHSDIPLVAFVIDIFSLVKDLPNDVGNLAPIGPAHNQGWNDLGDSPNGTTYQWYTDSPPPIGEWPKPSNQNEN